MKFNFLKHKALIIYSIWGIVTATGAGIFLKWAKDGDSMSGVNVIEKSVVLKENAQKEYLLRQKFNYEDVYLNVGDENNPSLIKASDCRVEYDFSKAGDAKVYLTVAKDSTTNYRGTFDVDVLFVRHIAIDNLGTNITTDIENRTIELDEDFVGYVEINGQPRTNYFDYHYDEENNKHLIKLDQSMYSTTVSESSTTKGCYLANIYCGNLSYSFNYYQGCGKTFYVTSEKDVVKFNSDDESSLTLIVTEKDSDSYSMSCVGKTKGTYIYRDIEGNEFLSEFNYELKEKSFVFTSEAATETLNGNEYKVLMKNNQFTVSKNNFEGAVVNGIIHEDHGYQLVVNSDKNILNIPLKDKESTSLSTLTLYVTKSTFDPTQGRGTAYGYYIYTNNGVKSYKLRFHVEAWGYQHIPLSSSDIESNSPDRNVKLSETVFLQEDENGNVIFDSNWNASPVYFPDLEVNLDVYVRGEGFVRQDVFYTDYASWQAAAF